MSDPKDAELLPDDHTLDAMKEATTVDETQVPTKAEDAVPGTLIALPLNQRPVFPTMLLPLVVPAGRLADAVKTAVKDHRGFVGFFLTKTPTEESSSFKATDLYEIGAAARIVKHTEVDGGSLQVFAQVVSRWRLETIVSDGPVVVVKGQVQRQHVDAQDPAVRSMAMAIVTALKDLVPHNPVFADEIRSVLANFNHLDGPSRLTDLAASLTTVKREELQQVLETLAIVPRMEKTLVLLAKETQLSQMKAQIAKQVEAKVSEHQRKFFLNEQLKAIKSELGLETDDKSLDLNRLKALLEKKAPHLTAETRQAIDEDLRKLSLLAPESSEYGVTRTRLEWLLDLPWGEVSEDNLDLANLREGLDADHYGLDDVKDRIVEFCAVRKLKPERRGGIIALVGPPGTGKTSIGASIAKQLGRKFYRFSLGGMRDEAEIKGHRRTYVGALPGKPVQALKRAGTMNPVIMLDEIDKLAHSHQGDPASALLEVLDPEQNKDFLDHYLDVRVDLSQVLFICTANDLGGIPEPLRDRMEIIRLAGYVEAEKVAIARDHLVPKTREAHGLKPADARFTAPASQCPCIDPEWENPKGVPISAFLFGGRVSKHFPLAFQSYNWEHGVYMAATMGSEATAAAIGQSGMRRDPMAMLPFCGYNMGDYWRHWLRIGRQMVATPPRIFRVNWFRKDEHGRFMWPGYGENMRVLKWVIDRCNHVGAAIESPLGWVPYYDAFDWKGLEFSKDVYAAINNIDTEIARHETNDQEDLFTLFGDHLPQEMELERDLQLARLRHSPPVWDLADAAKLG